MFTEETAHINIFFSLPKVELHRHLEGSLRLTTMLEIAQQHKETEHVSMFNLSGMVQIQDQDPMNFTNFLDKFKTLRLFYKSPEVITRVTREAVEDAAKDNCRYLELRFTPVALSRAEGFPMHDVMGWVIDAAKAAAEKYKIKVGLIASVNRHESPELAEQVAWLAVDRIKDGILGLDIAGNEADFKSDPFHGIFKEARQSGLHITAHAGEWGPAENIRDAIENLGAERIGHGVKIMDDENVRALVKERGTVFEVCATSNVQSGVVSDFKDHPLPRMMEDGLNVTINTDDPSVSRITLTREYQEISTELNVPVEKIKQSILLAAESSFLNEEDKTELVNLVREQLKLKP